MYPSDGLQNKIYPNAFLGNFAEGIIKDIQRARSRTPGDKALAGKPGQEIKDEERRNDYI
jgi:hypothetical protein